MTEVLEVGIDASRAYGARPTGTETYSARVIDGLARTTPHRLRLYVRTEPTADVPQGAEVRVLRARRLWTHTRLAMELRRRAPDVLFVPAHVLPVGTRCPSVVTVHDLGHRAHPSAHTWSQRAYLEWTTRRHAMLATLVVVDSRSTRDDLVRAFPQCAGRVRVAPLGVDEDMRPASQKAVSEARAAVGLSSGRQYLLYVGTLQPRKNLARLMAAFATVAGRWPEVDLVIAGRRGWGSEDLAALAERMGIASRVRFPGYVPRAALPGLYSGATALVHPSLYEGFGLTVAEAMACGTPVIASRTSSLPEVVGDAGMLFDPLDAGDIAHCLQAVLSGPALRSRLSREGRARSAAFTWERCVSLIAGCLVEAAR